MPARIELDLQLACETGLWPKAEQFQSWIAASLLQDLSRLEITVRIVDWQESAELNLQYRGKNKATNVLSFEMPSPDLESWPSLGDLVICAPLVEQEAQQQNKLAVHHWAHLIVHGMLHLQGYDHIEEADALHMEGEEIRILAGLGITNPYLD